MPHSLQQIETAYYQFERGLQEINNPFDNRLILMVNMPLGDGEQNYSPSNHLVQLLRKKSHLYKFMAQLISLHGFISLKTYVHVRSMGKVPIEV